MIGAAVACAGKSYFHNYRYSVCGTAPLEQCSKQLEQQLTEQKTLLEQVRVDKESTIAMQQQQIIKLTVAQPAGVLPPAPELADLVRRLQELEGKVQTLGGGGAAAAAAKMFATGISIVTNLKISVQILHRRE